MVGRSNSIYLVIMGTISDVNRRVSAKDRRCLSRAKLNRCVNASASRHRKQRYDQLQIRISIHFKQIHVLNFVPDELTLTAKEQRLAITFYLSPCINILFRYKVCFFKHFICLSLRSSVYDSCGSH